MKRRLVGGIVAAAFAIGILTGAAGSIVVRDATANTNFATVMADHMDDVGPGSMMSGSMMSPGSSFGPGMMSGPAASSMPGSLHDLHHPAASPEGASR
jgi:hypothetical protein